MKCRKCREAAVIEIRRHNAAFCRDCFLEHCNRQVAKAIKEHDMCLEREHILVAISGGKDSLALWAILTDLGYATSGLYIDLGIGEYSERSHKFAVDFANTRNLELKIVDLTEDAGFDVSGGARSSHRPPCSVCGISKRHWFNKVASEGGFDAIATGHNLDDESATLLGNLLHWQVEYVARQGAVLPATNDGFVRKIKPLIRLGERETAAYCVLSGIDYIVDECPMAAGNTGLAYKAALSVLEDFSPGTRQMFLGGFLSHGRERFFGADEEVRLVSCRVCASPTPAADDAECAYCRLKPKSRHSGFSDG
ncbi:MAG: tRNA(Ile)-lysidine synthetase [Acidobacteria bacterium]|nr:MAG: tRNA(Ile)-lysidine synthetase [Acidobacteriota bacterium]